MFLFPQSEKKLSFLGASPPGLRRNCKLSGHLVHQFGNGGETRSYGPCCAPNHLCPIYIGIGQATRARSALLHIGFLPQVRDRFYTFFLPSPFRKLLFDGGMGCQHRFSPGTLQGGVGFCSVPQSLFLFAIFLLSFLLPIQAVPPFFRQGPRCWLLFLLTLKKRSYRMGFKSNSRNLCLRFKVNRF